MSGSNPLSVALGQVVSSEYNPVQAMSNALSVARSATGLKSEQFNLQQAQLQPGYQAMRMLMATNPNPSDDDVNAALGGAARIGGNVDGLVQNYTAWRARGGTAADFVRAYSLGGMSPENQVNYGVGQPFSQDTGAGTVYGMRGGPLSTQPGAVTPSGFIQTTLTPGQATDMVAVGQNPDGSIKMVPRWQVQGSGAPGVGPAGAGGGGGVGVGGSALLPPGASDAVAAARIDQIGQRESGNQNIANRQGPGGTPASSASGPYQFLDSTWQQAAREYGIPNPTQRAMDTDPAIQRAVAIRFLQTHGEAPWAASAPSGGQGGPFIGAASAQPVTGGGAVAQPGGNVRPVGGVQGYDAFGRPIAAGGGGGGMPPGGYGGYTTLPAGTGESLVAAAKASTDQYSADNAAAGQFQQRVWPLVQAANILDKNAPTTGQGAEAVRSIIGHLQTLGNIFTGGDITNIGQSKFEELGKYMQQAVNASPFAASSNDKLAAAITGSPNTHMTNLANQDVLKAMIGLERMKQMAITDFNNQGGQPKDWTNFLRQWQTSHDPRAFVFDMLSADKRQQLVKNMSPAERTNFANTLTLVENNPGVMIRPAMP